MSGPSRLSLASAVHARLAGSWLKVYFGEVPDDDPPPVLAKTGTPDPSGRVAAYAVVYPGAGTPNTETDLADSSVDLDWGVQLKITAGFIPDLLDAVDYTHSRLHRWRPTGQGWDFHTDGLVPPPGFDPGLPRDTRVVQPPRFWLPLQYRLTATT